MEIDVDKARVLFKLIRRKKKSKSCYDRLEFYKRFDKKVIKSLEKEGLIIISRRGKKFDTVFVNPEKLKEAVEFVEKHLPYL